MTLYLFTLTPTELCQLARVTSHGDVLLSSDRARALVSGPSGPAAASTLPQALRAQTTTLTRAEAAVEWLGGER